MVRRLPAGGECIRTSSSADAVSRSHPPPRRLAYPSDVVAISLVHDFFHGRDIGSSRKSDSPLEEDGFEPSVPPVRRIYANTKIAADR
jgi:acetylornithine/succinyldiaminopimelate/putrescine aminotransferase